MPLTPPDGRSAVPLAWLGSPTPREVLYEAEAPVVFTVENASGQAMLAYVADEDATGRWLLLAPCTDSSLNDLRDGRSPVREALEASWMWLARVEGGAWTAAWACNLGDLPADYLPTPGLLLTPELEPVIATRAIGARIGRTTTPASVVAYIADATRKAVKGILEFVLQRDPQGRPPDELRTLYDLPVQRFAFASFEIAFTTSPTLLQSAEIARTTELLRKGLAWAASDGTQPLAATSDAERAAVLQAIYQLAPPTTGAIENIEVRGQWMHHRHVRLGRDTRRRIQAEIRRTRVEHVVSRQGRIGEFDKDNLTFTLRDTPGGVDVRGIFEEELYDQLWDHFTNDDHIVVIGIERDGKLHTSAASLVPEPDIEAPPEV